MTQELIDLQFDRAVEIVQGLPKNGPIQTGYEEKLAMYSLYKQATVGNVQSQRPGMWDMLGRAKWDAWAKQKDMDSRQAKWQYVETLMKVLRKYSDRTVARDLVQDLESYGDPSTVFRHASFDKGDTGSESSGSTNSERRQSLPPRNVEGETIDDDNDPELQGINPATEIRRPQSTLSSQMRYRTPMAGSAIGMPIPPHVFSPIPGGMQALPEHVAPSAFAPAGSPIPSVSYPTSLMQTSGSPHLSMSHLNYGPWRDTPGFSRNAPSSVVSNQQHQQIHSRTPLERAVEGMQTSLAALHERLEVLESLLGHTGSRGSSTSLHDTASRRWSHAGGSSSPYNRNGRSGPNNGWTNNMGAWSLILRPLSRLETNFRAFAAFIVGDSDDKSPILIMVRRLFLDISFLVVVLLLAKSLWRRTRMRRDEVLHALGIFWGALIGRKRTRLLVDKAV